VKNFIDVGAGVVDYDYRGNVGVVLFNHGEQDFAVARGDRVAQLILERISMAPAVEVQELSDTARGSGGFGSTGVQEQAATIAAQDAHVVSEPSMTALKDGEVICVKKLTDLAIIPARGSAFAAGETYQVSAKFIVIIYKLCAQVSISAALTTSWYPSTARPS
jgi:hypothetical protein